MQTRRCPGCMSLTDSLQCPVCGWREGQGNKPQQLQPGTVLQGRYVIGKALGLPLEQTEQKEESDDGSH